MLKFLRNRINASWLLLMAASFISWQAVQTNDHTVLYGIGAFNIAIAFAKVFVVGREFMELRLAPAALRIPFMIWSVVICVVLITIYAL